MINSSLYQLKIQQIKQEEELIKMGIHPEFLIQMKQLESSKSFGVQACKEASKFREIKVMKVYDSQVKFANDTFLVILRY